MVSHPKSTEKADSTTFVMNPFRVAGLYRVLFAVLLLVLSCLPLAATTAVHARRRRLVHTSHIVANRPVVARTHARVAIHAIALSRTTSRSRHRSSHRIFSSPWTEPTYADSTIGDSIDGEDLIVRKAAVDALGPFNGTVIVANPQTGRLLTIVNQRLGLKGAFQPCSTVKVVVSFASLREGTVDADTHVQLSRRYSVDMTGALAHSNNLYFSKLGERLGFEKVSAYSRMFGIGEKAGLDIPGEEPGSVTDHVPASGVGMMTSFGDGIKLTPLELTSIVSSVANGGTMYYLQYPKNQDEIDHFVPRIKRQLDIERYISSVKPGMNGAVEYGTARRASFGNGDSIYGKTGTCTDTEQPGVHLGWFGSFNEVAKNKVAVVVLLTGGRGVAGPIAAGVAGNVYQNLIAQHYFGDVTTTKLISMQK